MTTDPTTLTLEGDTEFVVTRTFRAPPRIVFQVYTDPKYIPQWWAPRSRGVVVTACEADVRVGGRYRYEFSVRGEARMAFEGEYLEVDAPHRLVYTESFCPDATGPIPGAGVITATFEEEDGATRYRCVARYPSKEVRDHVINSGMESGMRETYAQLDALAAGLTAV